MELKAIIANLEKYNNGHVIGERVSFPVSEAEIAKVFYRIGINGSYKEYFIAGYEGIWSGEIKNKYVSIEWLNSVAEHLQKFDENILSAALECWTLYDVLKMRPDDLRIHTGIYNEYDLGCNFIKESGFCGDCRYTLDPDSCEGYDCYNNSVKVIADALEKQIPKKPIMRKDVAETYYICPECEWEVDKFDDNYCSDCGQKLDWSSKE